MKLDDELCLCFHVTQRKLIQYVRVNRPAVASQLSECFGAGTGCGWCRPFLKQIFEKEQTSRSGAEDDGVDDQLPSAADYAKSRQAYRKAKEKPAKED